VQEKTILTHTTAGRKTKCWGPSFIYKRIASKGQIGSTAQGQTGKDPNGRQKNGAQKQLPMLLRPGAGTTLSPHHVKVA